MRTFLYFLLLLPQFGFAQPKGNFSLDVTIPAAWRIKKAVLTYPQGSKIISDTTARSGNVFRFRGRLREATVATLRFHSLPIPGTKWLYKEFYVFLEPSRIEAVWNDTLPKVVSTRSVEQDQLERFEAMLNVWNAGTEALYEKIYLIERGNDSTGVAALDKAVHQRKEQIYDSVHRFFLLQNPGTPLAPYLLNELTAREFNPVELSALFNDLPKAQQFSPTGSLIAKRIQRAWSLNIGNTAPDFTQPDTSGMAVALTSFRGQWVLVDFWASWCGPCRAENPALVKAYNRFKGKGFTILGVSLDRGRRQWLNAIQADGLPWTHVSDLEFWNNAAAVRYRVDAIPQNYLIDPKGRIVAKGLRGKALEQRLSVLLK